MRVNPTEIEDMTALFVALINEGLNTRYGMSGGKTTTYCVIL